MGNRRTSPYYAPPDPRRSALRRILSPWWLHLLGRKNRPLSNVYGLNRGSPIDRYYIDQFIANNSSTIAGRCLEISDDKYIRAFGHATEIDILDINTGNSKANLHADLRNMPQIADGTYDCIILTQVLQYIDDYESAIRECHRILKPGGTLLVTVPFISRIDVGFGTAGDYWRFTQASAEYVFKKWFRQVTVTPMGNVLSGLAFWIGMALEELPRRKLDLTSDVFPLLVAVKAVR